MSRFVQIVLLICLLQSLTNAFHLKKALPSRELRGRRNALHSRELSPSAYRLRMILKREENRRRRRERQNQPHTHIHHHITHVDNSNHFNGSFDGASINAINGGSNNTTTNTS